MRKALVLTIMVLSLGCGGSAPPTAPTTIPSTPIASVPSPPTPTFPALSGLSRTFSFDHAPSANVQDYTKRSQFVLYDDGAFVLQMPSANGGDYRGGYTESNGVITFQWEGWSVAGPWGATGTIDGGVLTVHYNLIMQLTDFEDAVYRLMK